MKKIKRIHLNENDYEVLSPAQMRKIRGASGGSDETIVSKCFDLFCAKHVKCVHTQGSKIYYGYCGFQSSSCSCIYSLDLMP